MKKLADISAFDNLGSQGDSSDISVFNFKALSIVPKFNMETDEWEDHIVEQEFWQYDDIEYACTMDGTWRFWSRIVNSLPVGVKRYPYEWSIFKAIEKRVKENQGVPIQTVVKKALADGFLSELGLKDVGDEVE